MTPMFARLASLGAVIASPALAEMPKVQTPAPVIFLADNLDEVDDLGWCIDTLGRGFADKLQAHSCKPQGGDVQFSLEDGTGLIRSVEFPEYCMEHVEGADPVFGLVKCAADNQAQQFAYNSATQAISPSNDPTSCIVVAETSRQAGPFMSRDLLLSKCSETDAAYRQWIIRG